MNVSNKAIAALVAALYPRFPLDTKDNRYHLQAFRHLYVLAVEPRFIETRDVDTNQPVYVPVKMTVCGASRVGEDGLTQQDHISLKQVRND